MVDKASFSSRPKIGVEYHGTLSSFFVLNNKQHGTSVCRKEWAFHMEHQSLCFKDMTMSGDTKFKLV